MNAKTLTVIGVSIVATLIAQKLVKEYAPASVKSFLGV